VVRDYRQTTGDVSLENKQNNIGESSNEPGMEAPPFCNKDRE